MLSKSRAVVLRSIPYGDAGLITRFYTENNGIITFLIKGARNGKGKIRSSHLQALNLVELDYVFKQNTKFQLLKELKCEPVLHDIYSDFRKNMVATYILELLNKNLNEEAPNKDLFNFIFNSILYLDLFQGSLANYPIYFSLRLSRFLGFYPKIDTYHKNSVFDLENGVFIAEHELSFKITNSMQAYWIYMFSVASIEELPDFKLNGEFRRELLEMILKYYRLHTPYMDDFKSLNILTEMV